MTLERKAISSAVSMMISTYVSMMISFVGNLILVRLLLLEDFGVFVLASSIVSAIFMFAGFSSQASIIQNRDEDLRDFIPTAFWISMAIALMLAFLGTGVGILLSGQYGLLPTFVVILSWLNVFKAASYTYNAILSRRMLFRQLAMIQSVSGFISFVVAIVSALLGAGAWALIIREVTAVLINLCAYVFITNDPVLFRFNRRSAQAIWNFGWKLMFSRISEVIFGQFDNLVVGAAMGVVTLGHYGLAYRLSLLGHQVTQSALQLVVFSVFSALQKIPERLQTAFNHMIYWLVRAALIMSVLVIVLGQDIVILIYTDKWSLAGLIFQNMWLFLGIYPLQEAVRHVLMGAGAINQVVRARFIMMLFFIPALILAGVSGEILAIVWVVNVSVLLGFGLMLSSLTGMIDVHWQRVFKAPVLAALGTLGCTQIILISLPSMGMFAGVVVKATLVLSTFCALLLLFERKVMWAELNLLRSHFSQLQKPLPETKSTSQA